MKKLTKKTLKNTSKNVQDITLATPLDVQAKKPYPAHKPDQRIPPAGTILSKTYRGKLIEVEVLQAGFKYEGKVYKSISRVAMEIVKHSVGGFVFFGLNK